MSTSVLPVVERELRIGARRPGTYWMRAALGAGVCVIWLLILALSPAATPIHTKAVILFWTVALLAFVFCLLSGAILTADCVSGEKRDGTLGLLFLTDLQPYDVVLGKLAATSLHAVYGLLCVLPALALCLLMGGVTMGEFWRATAVFGVTMFLSLTIGLAVSVISREARQATISTMAILVGLAGVPPFLAWLGSNFAPGSAMVTHFLLLLCPAYDLVAVPDKIYSAAGGAQFFWEALLVQISLGVLALLRAGSTVPRVWNAEHESSTKLAGVWERWFRFGSPASQRRRRRWIEKNPCHWLSTRDRLPEVFTWAVVLFLFLLWGGLLAGAFLAPPAKRGVCFAAATFMGYTGFVLWKTFLALEAARRIIEDRHNGALELLLVTKIGRPQIADGQRLALRRMFLLPGLVVMLMNLVLLGLVSDQNRTQPTGGLSSMAIFVFVVGVLCVAADLSALSDIGTWTGLRTRRLQYATLGMLGRVMLVPWLGIVTFAVVLISGATLSPGSMYIVLFFFMFLSLCVDTLVAGRARMLMEINFRVAAAGDFAAIKGLPSADENPETSPQPA